MKLTKITLIAITAIIIAACSTSKKTSKSTAPSDANKPIASVSPKPSNGVYTPGNDELTAIQVQYKEVTLEQLKFGHIIYTDGACTNCHGAKGIYKYDVANWKVIMDDMSIRAKLTDAQKAAVYKYVLAIKAAQDK